MTLAKPEVVGPAAGPGPGPWGRGWGAGDMGLACPTEWGWLGGALPGDRCWAAVGWWEWRPLGPALGGRAWSGSGGSAAEWQQGATEQEGRRA